MNNSLYLKLFAHCIPVKGHKRSTICDLQREDIYYIPNSMADMFPVMHEQSWGNLLEIYKGHEDTVKEYAEFLLENELAFWTDHPELFPPLSTEFSHPSYIANAIIDIGADTSYHFPMIVKKLVGVGCRHMQVRFFRHADSDELLALLETLEGSLIRSIELLVPDHAGCPEAFLESLVNKYKRIKSIFVHSASEVKLLRIVGKDIGYGTNMGNVIYTTQKIDSGNCCGFIGPYSFSVNVQTYAEATAFNTCLNRKIGIDASGNVKNCPSSRKVYGNIYEVEDLAGLLVGNEEFESLWKINKDRVSICNICEHRYVCMDCRVFTKDPADIYSKPAKCKYDPITAEWEC